jgi:Pyridoxamine 5'-phosphate oxidase
MATWRDLQDQRPDLAAAGRDLLYQFGVGLGFLATVRPDGGPRVHPICPILHEQRLLAFIVPSPKLEDIRRDGRYSLHCFPPADDEDAFYVTGQARVLDDPGLRAVVARQFVDERTVVEVPPPDDAHALVELDVDTVLLTRTTGHGDPAPDHTVWKASGTSP